MLKEEIIMRGKQLGFPRLSKKSHDNQATMIATIVQEAIEAEREACAQICENFADVDSYPDGIIQDYHAHLIRLRGKEQ